MSEEEIVYYPTIANNYEELEAGKEVFTDRDEAIEHGCELLKKAPKDFYHLSIEPLHVRRRRGEEV